MGAEPLFAVDDMWGGENSFFRKPFGDRGAPDLAPTPEAPSQGKVLTDILERQKQEELQRKRSDALQTGGMGVTDSPEVQTAAQLLLGS